MLNGFSNSLSDLSVLSVHPKYDSQADETSLPLWGVENLGNQYNNTQLSLIWGLVNSTFANHPNVSTVQQSSLYLSGYSDPKLGTFGLSSVGQHNLPASDFFVGAMNGVYNLAMDQSSPRTDYTGQTDLAMWAYWQRLAASAEQTAHIPNLIWTDNAAAAVVGTKGVLGPMNAASKYVVPLEVTPWTKRVGCHWAFAFPALALALAMVLITLTAILIYAARGHGLSQLRGHLNRTSPGRLCTSILYPQLGGLQGTSKAWNAQAGGVILDLSGNIPRASQTDTSAILRGGVGGGIGGNIGETEGRSIMLSTVPTREPGSESDGDRPSTGYSPLHHKGMMWQCSI